VPRRYNRNALSPATHFRLLAFLAITPVAYFVTGCAAALGPGYTIDKQEIRVEFSPSPEPRIHVDAAYKLRNDGNQPLSSLELRLPGRRRFHFNDPQANWDSASLSFAPSTANPRNVTLTFPSAWTVSSSHTLHLSVEYQPAATDEVSLSFTPDAFFLPAEGWSPELLPARGLFATGGVPPKTWSLVLAVPDGFLIHASGHAFKTSKGHGQQTVHATQQGKDGYPFVVAGRFTAQQLKAGAETVHLWTHAAQDAATMREPADALARAIQAYDSMFGTRDAESHQLWIIECPVLAGCFTSTTSNYWKLIAENNEKTSAELASSDTLMVDLSAGTPQIAAGAAPSLAASWLGYGQNPGFYEQVPPLSALPAFAASRGREAILGPQIRAETIRRALRAIPPVSDPHASEPDAVVRAKSLLFFYGLQDLYGQENFNNALRHMLYARRGGGFDLDDLIAAFEQETHQNVAQFVRRWMKHPGVLDDFRARYGQDSAAADVSIPKETTP
jgi:hypothetical protein